MENPMRTILELHVSGLGEGATPTFRLQPVGPATTGEAVHLDLSDFRALSRILDELSQQTATLARAAPDHPEQLL